MRNSEIENSVTCKDAEKTAGAISIAPAVF